MSAELLAHEIIVLRERSKRLFEKNDIDGWLESLNPEFRAVEKLRDHLLNNPVIVTDDPDVKTLLGDIDLAEIEDADAVGSEHLFSWISPAEYGSRLVQVSVLITPFQIPFELQCFLDEARQCYALGQFAAVQSLSRTILEAAVNDIAVSSGKIPRQAVEQDMTKEFPTWKRMKLVAGDRYTVIYAHYRNLCKVVHGLTTSLPGGALSALTKTIGFVQHLYDQNKDLIPNRKAV